MIQTTEVSITYKGDGVQTSFPYPYPYRNSDDIVGYIINDVGYEKRITNNFKYDKVSNIYQYPLAGAPLAAPYSIKLIRETPQQQNADLPGKLPFSLIEKSLDWIIMILQEIGSRCNSLWHIRNDCKLSETNARNSASAAAESEENAANSENLAKKWAMSPVSPDGVADTNSPTGYTQSAKIWAALSREYAGLSKFKLPIGYYTSVAEMKASDTAIVNRPCVTLGYYAANDGGGAVYIVRSKTDADTDNGGTIIVLDNGNVAELITPEVVCAEIFGAHGDGVSDDSDALQKMLDYGGNIVLNKNKKYAFSTTLKISKFSNIDFALAEMTYTGDDIGIIITGKGYAKHKSDIGNITNIYLHAPNSNKAISLCQCIKTRITNVRIYDFGKIAISIDVASYEAYLDDIRLVAKVKSGTVGLSGVASDMNFGCLYGLNVETFWACNGGGYNVDFIHAWCSNLNYYAEGLSTDEYNAWHAQTSLLKIDMNTKANDFFANFNYVYADTYHNVIYWDSYARNITIKHLGIYSCTKLGTFGGTVIDNENTTPYIGNMHISNVTTRQTDLLSGYSIY